MRIIEHYVNLFTEKEKEEYLDDLWNLITTSYSKIGGQGSVSKKEELLSDKYMWKLVRRNGSIDAFVVYKVSQGGRKISLCGSDGSEQGKIDLYHIIDEDLIISKRGVWAELSDAMEHIYTKKRLFDHSTGEELNLIVPAKEAIKILNKLGKEAFEVPSDSIHYKRKIGDGDNAKWHEKVLVGRLPDWLIDND